MEKFDFIYGKNAIVEALSTEKRSFNKIYIANNIHLDEKIETIKKLAATRKIVFQFVAKEKLNQLVQTTQHQGVVAQISPISYIELDDYIEQKNNISEDSVLLLDGVEDSHNLGSIIRSAVCAGFSAIIVPSRRGVLVNSTVEKVSAGAASRIQIIKVNSSVSAIQKLKESNYWVIASDHHSNDNYYDIDYTNMKFVIIMGAEHSGISKSLLKLSDYRVKIPMLTDFNSLNVSNAAAIIMFEAVRQKQIKDKIK